MIEHDEAVDQPDHSLHGVLDDDDSDPVRRELLDNADHFLGLGVSEPAPSWGNMLAALQQYHVLSSYWWMWAPGLALVPVFLAYFVVSETIPPSGAAPT